ncbi:unnamed protein product [Ranitomeya imitator]|uniref:Elongation of very long chain fatty acids protein n=1 Tax=Ranitomeya imitator TaxID=111125 RepID=A0ABN9M2L8_9NEOB|nr:unnamed protein product [Ranitomeya imitator]
MSQLGVDDLDLVKPLTLRYPQLQHQCDRIHAARTPGSSSTRPFPVILIFAIYLVLVALGPQIMEGREPFTLRSVLLVYNLALFLVTSVLAGYSYFCQPVDYSNSELGLQAFFNRDAELLRPHLHVPVLRSRCPGAVAAEISVVEATPDDTTADAVCRHRSSLRIQPFTDCPFPDGFNLAVFTYIITLIILFLNFYYQTYLRRGPHKKKL